MFYSNLQLTLFEYADFYQLLFIANLRKISVSRVHISSCAYLCNINWSTKFKLLKPRSKTCARSTDSPCCLLHVPLFIECQWYVALQIAEYTRWKCHGVCHRASGRNVKQPCITFFYSNLPRNRTLFGL